MLLFHTLVSLAIAAVAVAIHIQISVLHVPSFVRVAPKYLKLDTGFQFLPSIMMLTLSLFVLFTITLDFTVLISIPCALAVAVSLFVSSCNSLLLPAMRSLSSPKRKLQIGLPPMEIVEVWSWRVSCIILSRNRLKSVEESMHPCLTPMVIWKNLPNWLFRRTVLVAWS